ncbi:hypothetical protein EVAR_56850_1 [Eumeta japonica]|uniref:Uncharacterized protein n=1 Tax=Eumeta variegata TaxID=151549 RepID=A0A4C1Z942_EUMVA|nr:hypothetical protein EVAR_56850_1 [Eumeta japonica]
MFPTQSDQLYKLRSGSGWADWCVKDTSWLRLLRRPPSQLACCLPPIKEIQFQLFRHRDRSPSVQLHACVSVCGAAQFTSHGDSYATFAFVRVIRSGLQHRLHAEPTHGFCA